MQIDIVSKIKDIIDIEISGLLKLRDIIDHNFEKAINEIYNCKGKVILTGIGKSGLIAQKIASTMASTGTPAVFVHSGEGMHGDLGMIQPNDILLAISKSGESDELSSIIPIIKKIGATVVSITGNKKSEMARLSDVVIDFGDVVEACPYNLAPTTSTTVQLVLGDAIALILMKMREFSLDDFALFHPGGRLGKRLITKVSNIMLSEDNNPVIPVTANMKEVMRTISEKLTGAVSVVDGDGRLLGLIADYDIRKALEREEHIFSHKITDIMNSKPSFIYEDEKAFSALELMQTREKPITILPVINRERIVVGMLRLHDLVKEGL